MSQVQWSSRIGHVLAAAETGDRPWRHLEVSYVTATSRGGAFLLVFLLFSFTLGSRCWWGDPARQPQPARRARRLPQVGGAELALDGLHGDPVWLLHLQLLQRGGGWTVGYAALAVGGELSLSEASTLTALFTGYVSDPLWPGPHPSRLRRAHLVVRAGGLQQGWSRRCAG